jgi:AcrR family transcriptional regulator
MTKRGTFIETARRAQIIECAIDAIAELGYPKASLEQIAERAGVSASVIIYYFGSKKGLVREVGNHITFLRTAYLEEIALETTARTALSKLIKGNMAVHVTHPKARRAGMFLGWAKEVEIEPPEFYSAVDELCLTELQRIMEWGQRTGEFRQFDIPSMVRAVTAGMYAVPWPRLVNPDFDLDNYGKVLVEFFDRATRNDAA